MNGYRTESFEDQPRGLGGLAAAWFVAVALVALGQLSGSALAQVLPQYDIHDDAPGQFTNYQTGGSTDETTNEFFLSLGTNGRTCQTCHQPGDAFGLSTADIQNTYNLSSGTDPLFAQIDGADCLDSTTHNALLNYGLIRIMLPFAPKTASGATPGWTITKIVDPYKCQRTNANLQAACAAKFGPGYRCISVYRRPLPTTNLPSESAIMWDGREPIPQVGGLTASLTQQATDATLGHAQATTAPTAQQLADIVAFESAEFTTQTTDNNALSLADAGALEDPQYLSTLAFKYGQNDNRGSKFNENVMTLYSAWSIITGTDPVSLARASIQRGEVVFNNALFSVTAPGGRLVSCSFCHNNAQEGSSSNTNSVIQSSFFTRIGVDDPTSPATLAVLTKDLAYLPTFTIKCNVSSGGLNLPTVTTDPGQGLIDGTCASLQKMKVPNLHGLAARAPYFHNGSAPDLPTVVNFYNVRFSIGLTADQQSDLVNFLLTL